VQRRSKSRSAPGNARSSVRIGRAFELRILLARCADAFGTIASLWHQLPTLPNGRKILTHAGPTNRIEMQTNHCPLGGHVSWNLSFSALQFK
jgi:hypothetical protein